ncbi:MAG: hypothetical protein ACLSVD_06550 [Eggerthellaceae bacterium]
MQDLVAVALVVVAQDVGLGGAVAALALVGERRVGGEHVVLALLLVLAMHDAHGRLLSVARPSATCRISIPASGSNARAP